MMLWSHPDIYNSIHGLAKHMTFANEGSYQVMLLVMEYCNATPKQGLLLNPVGMWDGKKGF